MPEDLLCNSACFMNYNYSLLIVWHSICPPFPIKQSSRPNITALTTLVFPLRPRPTPLSASMGLRSSTLRPSLQPFSLPTPRVTRQHPISSLTFLMISSTSFHHFQTPHLPQQRWSSRIIYFIAHVL